MFIRSAVVIAIMLGALTLPATARPYAIVGLGDSAAEQLGATVRCEAWVMTPSYACPDGTGFIEQFARSLDRHGPTAFQNLASKFARTVTVGLEQVPMMSRRADIVVVYVGTNDSAFIADHRGYTMGAWYDDYDWLLSLIRRRAPQAHIILVTVPEPPTGTISDARAEVIGAMNRHILGRHTNVLDLNCGAHPVAPAFLDSSLDYLGDRGSAVMAKGLLEIIKAQRQRERHHVVCASFGEH